MRLIDASLLKTEIRNKLFKDSVSHEHVCNCINLIGAIDTQPMYNPWRKIDDVKGLEEGDYVITYNSEWIGNQYCVARFDGYVIETESMRRNPKLYMQIPEVHE